MPFLIYIKKLGWKTIEFLNSRIILWEKTVYFLKKINKITSTVFSNISFIQPKSLIYTITAYLLLVWFQKFD